MPRSRAGVATVAMLLSTRCSGPHLPTAASPPPPYTLSGTVVTLTETGSAPLPGALVQAGALHRSVLTDSDGAFSITGLPAGGSVVVASLIGYNTDSRTVTLPSNLRLDITLSRQPTYLLSGIAFEATPAGRVPIEGVEIYCESCGSEGRTFAETESDGQYAFSEVPPATHALLVRKAGFDVVNPVGSSGSYGETVVKVVGDMRFDIQLVRR